MRHLPIHFTSWRGGSGEREIKTEKEKGFDRYYRYKYRHPVYVSAITSYYSPRDWSPPITLRRYNIHGNTGLCQSVTFLMALERFGKLANIRGPQGSAVINNKINYMQRVKKLIWVNLQRKSILDIIFYSSRKFPLFIAFSFRYRASYRTQGFGIIQ